MEMTLGEKLIALMLCDLFDHLGVESDIEPQRLREAISSGHIWGVREQLGGLIATEDSPDALRKEVGDLLWMWAYLEDAYERLDEAERAELKELVPHGTPVRFWGFDGNNEAEFISVARHLIKDPEFHGGHFAAHALNAHHPTIARHRAMYVQFMALLETPERDFGAKLMGPTELASVLNAR